MASAQSSGPIDPYRNFNFRLEIGGVTEAAFFSVQGLAMRIHPIRYRPGGDGQAVRSLPGPVEYAEVTLRHGLTKSTDLWNWISAIAKGRIERRNVSILLLETDGVTEALRWNLLSAWPCEWHGPALDGLGRDIAFAELKLAYDELRAE
ncbi:phage tail-like protein [Pseudochelatococcus lubricantis]|uniref:Phage tail-like protein n=1 Tax=Pseudochelatococcus lubricantis TaxID=1538102 RepID=A0ABX0UXK4_9HYPH|nr:phage tail protein [Pseudochelatococcus lubricantis]NIJ57677.1 phage tail-like protein [Pseudochelatococcus lubricantis]